ncbi:ribosome production factor 2 homolog [Lampetra fluviatilis]
MERIVKPRTQRGKRLLEERAGRAGGGAKLCLLLRGGATGGPTQALRDTAALKKPWAVMLKRKNAIRPFEDTSSLEFLTTKAEASLFLLGSHSKKRPQNLVMGRIFDGHVLDMVEMGIKNFSSLRGTKAVGEGVKPLLIFSGDFSSSPRLLRLQNLLLDFYRGPTVPNVSLLGLELVLNFTAVEGDSVLMRGYRVELKRSGSRCPRCGAGTRWAHRWI